MYTLREKLINYSDLTAWRTGIAPLSMEFLRTHTTDQTMQRNASALKKRIGEGESLITTLPDNQPEVNSPDALLDHLQLQG